MVGTCHKEVEGIEDPAKLPTVHLPNLRTLCLGVLSLPHISTLVLSLLRVPRMETLEFELVGCKKAYGSDFYHFADQVGHLLQQAKIIRLNTNYKRCEKLESDLVYFLERAHSLRELRLC